jgi:hypothetical protein
MNTNKNLSVVAAILVCCVLITWFSTSIRGVETTYEVRPQISLPEYKTDAGRAIDAYERLMERHMNMTERNLNRIGTDIQQVTKKLDSIDGKLTELSFRMAKIEKVLGIEQPRYQPKKQIQSYEPQKKAKPFKPAPKPEEF